MASPIESTIQSLGQNYRAPEWFRDAKFGVYMHWGVYSVVGRNEWYPRHMYVPGHPDYEHHIKTYGHPSVFGYKDLVPLWKAERFDPDEMLDTIRNSGAKYFAPCAVHHDNFFLWDSKIHRWNAAQMGPKKDLLGMLKAATEKAGLRWGVTTHMARTYSWLQTNKNSDEKGAFDGNDAQYKDFYLDKSDDRNRMHPLNPPRGWRDHWKACMTELIDRYEPDHLYFDGALPFRGDDNFKSGMEILAYYYNRSIERHGKLDSVMFMKNIDDIFGPFSHGLYINNISSLDIEQSHSERIIHRPWQTDFTVLKGGWSYYPDSEMYQPEFLIHMLIDIVSKNGNLLLNVPPKPDGTFEDRMTALLEEIGRWMRANGDAVYGTRPWVVSGQGEDIRFTVEGGTLNAFLLSWPETGRVTVDLPEDGAIADHVKSARLLATGDTLPNTKNSNSISITLPDRPPRAADYAWCIQLDFGHYDLGNFTR